MGKEEVSCYVADIAERFEELDADLPKYWYAIGYSGVALANTILQSVSEKLRKQIQIVVVSYDKSKNEVFFMDAQDASLQLVGSVLIIDSAVHSGSSMLAVTNKMYELGAQSVVSYSLVIKRGTSFVPNYFGLVIGDHDRALFLLNKYPNNRLCRKPPFGTLRALSEQDVHKPQSVNSGVTSIDNVTWGDLLYDKVTKGASVYLFENAQSIMGYISFRVVRQNTLFVDAIVVDKSLHGVGLGGMLMRWAETSARSLNCCGIELYAIEERKGTYEKLGFSDMGHKVLDLGNEKYWLMNRKLLYNLDISNGAVA